MFMYLRASQAQIYEILDYEFGKMLAMQQQLKNPK